MRKARPAAEMEPDRAISSSTAIFPGPIRSPPAKSILMFRRSPALPDSSDFCFFFGMTRYPNTTGAQDQSYACPGGLCAVAQACRDDNDMSLPMGHIVAHGEQRPLDASPCGISLAAYCRYIDRHIP